MKKLQILDSMCAVTKRVVQDFNTMSNMDFFRKYQVCKETYYKRVKLYGDPYMKAPLAKFGKWLIKHM